MKQSCPYFLLTDAKRQRPDTNLTQEMTNLIEIGILEEFKKVYQTEVQVPSIYKYLSISKVPIRII